MTTESIPEASRTHPGDKNKWMETTPGESFCVRLDSEDTNGAYALLEVVASSRNGAPMHVHHHEDELFIILEGTLTIANGGHLSEVTAGMTQLVQKGVPHAWANTSDAPVRMLVVFTPSGIEGLFLGVIGRKSNDISHLLQKYGCEIVGPTLTADLHQYDLSNI